MILKLCIKIEYEKDGKPWCSTSVDENGKHISGQKFWGHCGPECLLSNQTQPKRIYNANSANLEKKVKLIYVTEGSDFVWG